MQGIQESIELKIKILAQRLRETEAQNQILRAENSRLKEGSASKKTQFSGEADEKALEFETQLANVKKAKRELEMYLREVERKIELIKF